MPEENAEMNVVPFIDIMLVLLIIFILAAPLATVDVNVDLPASTAQPAERPDTPIYLTLRSDLTSHLGKQPVAREALANALDARTEADKEARIFLRSDNCVDYGDFTEVMNLLREAGYLKIALVGLETLLQPGVHEEASGDAAPPAARDGGGTP